MRTLPRLHLVELEDLPWYPPLFRDLATDYLRHMESTFAVHRPIVPVLADLIRETGETRLVDLCSGGGGPAADVARDLAEKGFDVALTLTDLYPNLPAFEASRDAAPERISFVERSVDARDVGPELAGIRTIFNALHHFRPDDVRAVLADAVRARQPIAVFDIASRALWRAIGFQLTPLVVLLVTPFIRPFTWRRLFWTYLIPAVPFTCWWDGTVSLLRSYRVDELEAFGREVDTESTEWRAGELKIPSSPGPIPYLVGVPRRADETDPRAGGSRAATP